MILAIARSLTLICHAVVVETLEQMPRLLQLRLVQHRRSIAGLALLLQVHGLGQEQIRDLRAARSLVRFEIATVLDGTFVGHGGEAEHSK